MSNLIIGRGPDGQNVRVNAQGVGVPIGTPAKAAGYNPGTLQERLAIRAMQERARQRARGGQPAQVGYTYAQTMAEWNAAQAQANEAIQNALHKKAKNGALDLFNSNEFSLDDFLPDYLRADRGRSRILQKQGRLPGDTTWMSDKDSILDTSSSNDPSRWRIAGPDPLGYDYPGPQTPGTNGLDLAFGLGTYENPPLPVPNINPPVGDGSSTPIVGDRDHDLKKIDPTLQKYQQLRAEWVDAAQKGVNGAVDTADGDFGTSAPSTSTAMGVNQYTAFQYLLVGDGMDKTIEKGPQLYSKLVAEAMNDPQKAGFLMTAMAAVGAYGAGSEKYVQDRLYLATDKNGKPTLKGRFTVDDAKALAVVMPLIANDQANKADEVIARGGSIAEIPGFEELLEQRGLERQDMAGTLQPAGDSGGGGGGGRRRGGGGFGGGGGGAARFTDPEQLKSLIDGIARQRLGRILTVEEAQEFANYYHSQEAASGGINFTSGGGRVLDPESQAIAWIESRYRDEGARQQQGQYVSTLLKMLSGSEFAMGGS